MAKYNMEQLHKAHIALEANTAMAEVLTPAFGAKIGLTNGAKLSYSPVWLHHRRHEVEGTKFDVAPKGGEWGRDAARVTVVRLVAEGCSWGEIAVRMGCGGHRPVLTDQGNPVSESWVRRLWEETGVRSVGLRIAHKGGRWVADRSELYDDSVGRGERGEGVVILKSEPIPVADPEAKAANEALRAERKEAKAQAMAKALGQAKPKATRKPKAQAQATPVAAEAEVTAEA